MAELRVNPTRMELLRLKQRLKLAEKGHKLLKEKRDGLMQEFLKIVRNARDLRQKVDDSLGDALKDILIAESVMLPQAVDVVGKLRTHQANLSVDTKNVMGVELPRFDVELEKTGEEIPTWETSPKLSRGAKKLQDILPTLLELAAIEKSATLLALEIETTRRRVNALEHVLIPQLKDTTKYIRMKLDEQERSAIITTMAVKESIEN